MKTNSSSGVSSSNKTSTFSLYSRFIAQIVFTLLLSGVGIAMIFKDWEKKGSPFWMGLMMVTNSVSWWIPNPKKPKSEDQQNSKFVAISNLLSPNVSPNDEGNIGDIVKDVTQSLPIMTNKGNQIEIEMKKLNGEI